jgi:hypothetical protein
VGLNLAVPAYYTNNLPFLNLFHQAVVISSSGYIGPPQCNFQWGTRVGVGLGGDTGEEAFIPLDSDGWPTAVSAAGKTFNTVMTAIVLSLNAAPNQSNYFPGGTYRLQYAGTGTVQIIGDGSVTLSNSSDSQALTSTTFTVSPGTYISGSGTLLLGISATDVNSTGHYVKNISIVQNTYASLYDSGQRWHPLYVAALAPFSSLRFMDMFNTNNDIYDLWVGTGGTTDIPSGSTSCTLQYAWNGTTQTRTGYFASGDTRQVTLTYNSTSVTWSTPTTADSPYNYTLFNAPLVICWKDTFANRALPSNAFWTGFQGLPFEAAFSLCNQLNTTCYVCLSPGATDGYFTSFNQLAFYGAGAQGGILQGNQLNSPNKIIEEISNETWNFARQGAFGTTMGNGVFPSYAGVSKSAMSGNYFGFRTAVLAEVASAVWGASYNTRCTVTVGGQAAQSGVIGDKLTTPYWVGTGAVDGYTGPASNHPINGASIAPYFGFSQVGTWTFSATGTSGQNMITYSGSFPASGITVIGCGLTGTGIGTGATITGVNYTSKVITLSVNNSGTVSGTITADDTVLLNAQSDGGLTLLFAAMYAQTYNSAPSGGYVGQTNGWISNTASYLSSYPSIKLIGYEGGNSLSYCGGTQYTLQTMLLAAQRDPRMTTFYAYYFQQWANLAGSSAYPLHQYYDIGLNAGNNQNWGAAESLMQNLLNGESYVPAKWQGLLNFIT